MRWPGGVAHPFLLMLAGEVDFLLKIVAQDWEDYQQFVTSKLTAAHNVTRVKSALSIRASKREPGVPMLCNAKQDPPPTSDAHSRKSSIEA